MSTTCKYRRKDSSWCRANAQATNGLCLFHDPEKAADGRRARRAGGISRSRVAAVLPPDTPDCPLEDARDVSKFLAQSINQLRRGQLDPKVDNALGYVASVLLRSLEQGRAEDRVAGGAVGGSTFRERFKSMWLFRKEAEMIAERVGAGDIASCDDLRRGACSQPSDTEDVRSGVAHRNLSIREKSL